MNTTHRLHAFYAHVGAAIPLTGTVEKHLNAHYCIELSQFPGLSKLLSWQMSVHVSHYRSV